MHNHIVLQVKVAKQSVDQQLRASEQQALFHQEKARQLVERLQSVERASRLSVSSILDVDTSSLARRFGAPSDRGPEDRGDHCGGEGRVAGG